MPRDGQRPAGASAAATPSSDRAVVNAASAGAISTSGNTRSAAPLAIAAFAIDAAADACRVFDDDTPATLRDGDDATRSICAAAGQDDGDQSLAIAGGCGQRMRPEPAEAACALPRQRSQLHAC